MTDATLTAPALLVPRAAAAGRPQPATDKSSAMGKIFLLVGIAIVVFMAFTGYSVHKELQGRKQLSAIKDMYFPLLQRLDANIVRLDKIQELYVQVVITGDRDTIAKATELGAQADQAFGEIATLYPGHLAEIGQLRADLRNYQDIATKASLSFLTQDRETAAPIAARMNLALADVNARLKAFRQAGYDGFVSTLARSQKDAEVRLMMGLALGLMNLGFMVVLVYFIRNNLRMMSLIEVQNATLEQRVAERTSQLSQKTNDINAMLHNMKLGVSTVVPGNRIHPEYSNYLREIFSSTDDLAGKDLVVSLFDQSSLGVDSKDQIDVALAAILGEDPMAFEFNSHLLVREMELVDASGRHKIVQLDWNPIVSEQGTVEKVLLITQDVTHLRELEQSAAKQKDELQIISRILKVAIGKFNDFVESARGFIAANRRLLADGSQRSPDTITALFRNMHTIKGNARTFEFAHITDVAHAAEQTYDRLRKDPEAKWDAQQMRTELDAVEAALARYVEISEDTLGRKGRASDLLSARGAFVGNDELAQIRTLVASMGDGKPGPELIELRKRLARLGHIDLRRIVSGAVDSLSSLSKELAKPTPSVDIVDGDVAFQSEFAGALKSCFMHMLRNSLDHGIESPAERARANKPESGRIRLECEYPAEGLRLHVRDDGRGLALDRLHQQGVQHGMFSADDRPTRAAVAEVIFRSGLSTASRVTQVSGRGVGMEAVRTFLQEQGAAVCIRLDEPSGTELGLAPFEFVIDVPGTAFVR